MRTILGSRSTRAASVGLFAAWLFLLILACGGAPVPAAAPMTETPAETSPASASAATGAPAVGYDVRGAPRRSSALDQP